MLKGGMEISTYQRGVQVQTVIQMTTLIIITKIESLTLILERIEAHISLPNNAPLLSILRFGTAQRDCVVQQAQADLSCSIQLFRDSAPIVFCCLRNSGWLPSLGFLHAPLLRRLLEFGFISLAFPNLDVSYPKCPDCLHPLEGQGGPVVSLAPSVPWVEGRLSGKVQ